MSGFDLWLEGRTLPYIATRPGKTGMELWSGSLDGGQPVLLREALHFLAPRVSRDGTRVAFRITPERDQAQRLAWRTFGVDQEQTLPQGFYTSVGLVAERRSYSSHLCYAPPRVALHLAGDRHDHGRRTADSQRSRGPALAGPGNSPGWPLDLCSTLKPEIKGERRSWASSHRLVASGRRSPIRTSGLISRAGH